MGTAVLHLDDTHKGLEPLPLLDESLQPYAATSNERQLYHKELAPD